MKIKQCILGSLIVIFIAGWLLYPFSERKLISLEENLGAGFLLVGFFGAITMLCQWCLPEPHQKKVLRIMGFLGIYIFGMILGGYFLFDVGSRTSWFISDGLGTIGMMLTMGGLFLLMILANPVTAFVAALCHLAESENQKKQPDGDRGD